MSDQTSQQKHLEKIGDFLMLHSPAEMASPPRLSTTEIVRVAEEKFCQLSSKHLIDLSMISHFFDAGQFGLPGEEIKDVELVLLLLAALHKYRNQGQIKQARSFLNLCEFLSSNSGNSVQRLVHHFTRSLRERIDRETNLATPRGESESKKVLDPHTSEILNPALIACILKIPYVQVVQFASIQAILEGLATAKRVHFIDLAVRTGGHCTVLIANRRDFPVEHLKITAVGTEMQLKLEEIGRSLASFAQTLNVSFSFRTAMVGNLIDLKEDTFEISDDEVVAVYFPFILRNIRAQPADCLESLIRILKSLDPCVVVIIEMETDHNSSDFKERFMDALFFYSAHFDCLDDCIDRSDPGRMTTEAFLGQEIRDAIVSEEKDKAIYHTKIAEWRDCLAKFGMVENELSVFSIYHAGLLLNNLASGKPCTLERLGDCLIAGWKKTPILSVSSWKFHHHHQLDEQQATRSCTTRKSRSC